MNNILYRAGFGWKGKMFASLYSVFWVLILASHPNFIVRFWQQAGWFGRASEVILLLTILLIPLDAYVSQTIFTDRHINHRSLFGLRSFKEYAHVQQLLVDRDFLKIHFLDGTRIRIWRSKGDLRKMCTIIKENSKKDIPVQTTS